MILWKVSIWVTFLENMRGLRLYLRAQLFLHARVQAVLLAIAATAVLLACLSSVYTSALQLRCSPPRVPSPFFYVSPATPPTAPFQPQLTSAPSSPLFVGSAGSEHAATAPAPRHSVAAAVANGQTASDESALSTSLDINKTTHSGSKTPWEGGPTPFAQGSSAAAGPTAVAPAPALERTAAVASTAAAVVVVVPTAASPPVGAIYTRRLAFVSALPAAAASSCRRGLPQRSCATHNCSSSSSHARKDFQRQAHGVIAAADNYDPCQRKPSWLGGGTSLLQHRPLSARPSGALDVQEAVVEGGKVNGKCVRDWTVERTLYQALHMAIAEEMQRDPSVCIMGEDVGHYGGSYKVTKDLHAVFGNLRVMDTPICENTFTGMAIGAAMNGLRPVVEGMNMGFLLLAFNQISNNAGMVRYTSGGGFDIPIVIRGPGGVGKQLGPEHSQRIEAYLMAVPGLKMVACSTPHNARGLLKSAIRENNPIVFFEHVLTYNVKESIPLLPYTLPLDRAEVARQGSDVTVLAYGKLRYVALDAAKQLDSLGVSTEVLDLVSLKPLDLDSICKSVRKTGLCVVLDESSKTGGIGGEILSQVVENCADILLRPPVRLATKDIPTPYARGLEEATIVTPADIVNAALWMLSSRPQPTIARYLRKMPEDDGGERRLVDK